MAAPMQYSKHAGQRDDAREAPAHVEVSLVQLLDGSLGSSRVVHSHKGKATGAATLTVLGDEGIL